MRAKKTLKNLIFNFLQQVIAIITNFIIPPLIIGKFGSSINGLVSTIKQITNHAQLTGAGISSVSTYAMYKPLSENNIKKLNGIYSATNKMFIKAGNLFSLVLILVATIYPCFVNEDVNYFVTAVLVVIIGINGLSEFYLIGKYQSILNADQKNFVIAIAQTLGNIFNVIITVILIKLNQGIILVQLGAAIVYVLRVIIINIYVKRNYKYLDKKEKPLMEELNQRNDAIIHSVTDLIINSSATVIVSIFCGLEAASIYAVYALVFAGINTICSIVSNAIYASFGEVIAKKDNKILKSSYNIYEWIYLVFISIIFSVTTIIILPFVNVYTKGVADINYILPALAGLFIFIGYVNNLKIPARTLVTAAGHFKQTKNRSLIELILNLTGQLIFVQFFGIYGALIGASISYIYRTIDFINYSNKRILFMNNKRSIYRIIINVLIGVILVFTIGNIIKIECNNYIQLVVYAVIVSVIVGLVYLISNYFIEKPAFKETTNIIKGIFKREKNVEEKC